MTVTEELDRRFREAAADEAGGSGEQNIPHPVWLPGTGPVETN